MTMPENRRELLLRPKPEFDAAGEQPRVTGARSESNWHVEQSENGWEVVVDARSPAPALHRHRDNTVA